MGLINAVLGNASEINLESIKGEFSTLLCSGEHIDKAYKIIRDKWVFTNKRLIIQDIQGITGKKKEYLSIPYHSVDFYSIETAGTFDTDAELKLWIKGRCEPFEVNFGRDAAIFEIQKQLAVHVL